MQRVMIIGQPGSGKSTLARLLGEKQGLPVIHIDQIHWMPHWVERPHAEKVAMALEVQAGEAWIMEGGLSATWEDRMQRCDTLIWLDVPLLRRFYRVIWRTLRTYGRARPDMHKECPERFSLEFYQWIWDTRQTGRENCEREFDLAKAAGKDVVRLETIKEVRAFLE